MTIQDVRAALMDSLTSVQAALYDQTPPVVATPAVFVFPADPYLDFPRIGAIHINLRLTAAVAFLDNAAALSNLETLAVAVTNALPNGCAIQSWSAPSITQVGPSNLLVTEMTVTIPTTL